MMRKILLKLEKEIEEPVQRTSMFRTTYKTKDIVYKVIIDSGSIDNLVSTDMVEKMELKTTTHPNPYKVSWLQKGHCWHRGRPRVQRFNNAPTKP
jgi:hypothetical protein